MAILGRTNDYTDRDFDSLRLRLRNLIRGVFPEWTNENVANFGNILVELFAHVGDVVSHYQDSHARESRIVTARQRKNLIGLAKLVGFRPATASAATVDVTVTIEPTGDAVTIPAGTVVRTEARDPVRFQLVGPLEYAAGETEATALAEHASTHEEDFPSTNLPNQTYRLSKGPYLDGGTAVVAADGVYDEVENFLNSTSNDRHYTVVVDENDRATLRFGNGVLGTIPQGTVTVEYKTGGGEEGNVEAGALRVLEGNFQDDSGATVTVTDVTNAAEAAGGTNRHTREQIRQLAPEQLRVLNRTVAREDYEINAERLPEVARALMLTADQDGSIEENHGLLFVVPAGGGVPSTAVKDAALKQVTEVYPNTITFQVEVRDPEYLEVDVFARVFLRSGRKASAVASTIRENLAGFFALTREDGTRNPRINFGFHIKDVDGNPASELPLSDLYNVVRDTEGVRKLGDAVDAFTLNDEYADVQLAPRDFPVLGKVTLVDGDTGAEI